LEDVTKVYDALILNDVWSAVENAVPQSERDYIWNNILDLAREVTAYNNSLLGILNTVSQNYSNLDLDATEIQKKLADPENMALLKQMVSKTGLVN
jgi:hypothetical protein